jgi:hypothetical protein
MPPTTASIRPSSQASIERRETASPSVGDVRPSLTSHCRARLGPAGPSSMGLGACDADLARAFRRMVAVPGLTQ